MNHTLNSIGRRADAWILASVSAVVLASCTGIEAKELAARTEYGDAVNVGNGTVRSYITTVEGVPQEIGIAVSEAALAGLPGHHDPGGVFTMGHTTFENVIELPENNSTPFRHVLMNWNPGGHEPPGIYDMPHFDFHFYTISNEERLAIDEKDPAFKQKGERLPAPELIPQGYILPAPLAFPRMGVHWVDPTSPELNGQKFTRTFIYGTWDGRVIFAEPMITREFLESKQNFSAPLPAPNRYEADGFYPTGYTIRWDAATKEWRIALTGLIERKSVAN